MSNEQSDEKDEQSKQPQPGVRVQYEALLSMVSLLVAAVYSYNSIQFRIEAQERAIISLCDKINILLISRKDPYQIECRDK